jgi:hypothetical protein
VVLSVLRKPVGIAGTAGLVMAVAAPDEVIALCPGATA